MERLLRGCENAIVVQAAAVPYRDEHRSWLRKGRIRHTHEAEPDVTGQGRTTGWLRIEVAAESAAGSRAALVPAAWIGLRMPRSPAAARTIWMCASIAEEAASKHSWAWRSDSSAAATAAWWRRRASRSCSGDVEARSLGIGEGI